MPPPFPRPVPLPLAEVFDAPTLRIAALMLSLWALLFRFGPYAYLSDLHVLACAALAAASILDAVPENWLVFFSVSYFLFDGLSCARRGLWPFVVHHVLTLVIIGLGLFSVAVPEGRMTSWTLLIEISTLFLNHFTRRKSSSARYFALLVAYFLNRPVYMTWLLYFGWTRDNMMHTWMDYGNICLLRGLHVLITLWWVILARDAPRYWRDWGRKEKA